MKIPSRDIPPNWNALAYLDEVMQQLPGAAGCYELSRQLAATSGRARPWTRGYLQNLRTGRQPIPPAMKLALYRHSRGDFTVPESTVTQGQTSNLQN
jgi:hypothetical protein